jgi:glycine oxidase
MELARHGMRVLVLEKGRAMAEASWAAAGMLAANDPEHPEALTALASLSSQLYPDYLRRVEELSGLAVPLRTRATLLVGVAADSAAHATGYAIDAAEAERRVPGLAAGNDGYWWMEEASLDPRDLCVALPRAATAAGVEIRQDTAVLSVSSRRGSVAVTTAKGTLEAGAFVNCCGAWAGLVRYPEFAGQPAQSVEPRKGQMLTVQLAASPDLDYVVRAPEIYLVPRGGGQVVIGATVERAGFDRRLDPEALQRLRGLAAAVWPPIAGGVVADSWSGLRPGTPDSLPLIGNTGEAHCWVASGHFRNGILLAPGTAVVVRQLLQGAAPAVDLAAFAPGRSVSASDKIQSAGL